MFCPLLIFFISQLFRNIIRVVRPDLGPNSLQRNYQQKTLLYSFFLIILAHSFLNIILGSADFEILREKNKLVVVLYWQRVIILSRTMVKIQVT